MAVALAALSVNAEQETLVDFSQAYFRSSFAVAVREEEQSISAMFQGIFSGTFLRAAGLLLLLLTAVGTFIWITSGAATAEQFGDGFEVVCSSFWRSALTTTTVRYDKSPRPFTGRVIGLMWSSSQS